MIAGLTLSTTRGELYRALVARGASLLTVPSAFTAVMFFFTLAETGDGLLATLEYDCELFEDQTAAALLERSLSWAPWRATSAIRP